VPGFGFVGTDQYNAVIAGEDNDLIVTGHGLIKVCSFNGLL
jgi:hypothetical protein